MNNICSRGMILQMFPYGFPEVALNKDFNFDFKAIHPFCRLNWIFVTYFQFYESLEPLPKVRYREHIDSWLNSIIQICTNQRRINWKQLKYLEQLLMREYYIKCWQKKVKDISEIWYKCGLINSMYVIFCQTTETDPEIENWWFFF